MYHCIVTRQKQKKNQKKKMGIARSSTFTILTGDLAKRWQFQNPNLQEPPDPIHFNAELVPNSSTAKVSLGHELNDNTLSRRGSDTTFTIESSNAEDSKSPHRKDKTFRRRLYRGDFTLYYLKKKKIIFMLLQY